VAKTIVGRNRTEERIGVADDLPLEAGAIGYKAAVAAALAWSVQQHAVFEAAGAASRKGPTVRSAVENYSDKRDRLAASGTSDARGRLRKHVLADQTFADTALAKLAANDLQEWREGLTGLAAATENRLLNDLRAALNDAAVTHRRELPAHFAQEVRIGTKRIEASDVARRQILTDKQILALVAASFEVDDTGDFGRLVTLLAATGARHSQAARVKVGGYQHNRQRIMVPGSRKGRSRSEGPPVAVQLSPDVCDRLAPAAEGRNADEPLLMRWHWSKKGFSEWTRTERRPWRSQYEADRLWPETVRRAGVPDDTVMYAFRHSSIVRGLRANLPIRLVASLHDTSVEMIEKHYSAFIVDATEDLARRALLSFSEDGKTASSDLGAESGKQIQPLNAA
jgi:hypothetical protein